MGSVIQTGFSDLLYPSLSVGKVLSFSNRFQGTGGTVFRDQSPRDNDGNLAGATTGVILKHEYLLDGVDDYVACGDIKTTGPATVSMWIYPTAEDDRRLWAQASGSTGQSGAAGINSGLLRIWNGGAWKTVVSSGIALNEWQHVLVTYNGNTTATGWLNGNENTTTGVGTDFEFDGVGFDLFGRLVRSFGNEFEGRCKDVIIYSRALADDEIRTLAIRPDIATERTPYVYEPIRTLTYPSLSRGRVGAWCPSEQGPGGLILRDLSGGKNHDGTFVSMLTDSWQNQSLYFDGTEYVEIPYSNKFNPKSITVEAWINTTMAAYGNIIDRDPEGAAGRQFQFRVTPTGVAEFVSFIGGGSNATTGVTAVNTGKWVHVAASYQVGSGQQIVWVNGKPDTVEAKSGAGLDSETSTDAKLWIGTHGNGTKTQKFTGYIDAASLYSRALNPADIRLLATRRKIAYETDSLVSPFAAQWGSVAAAPPPPSGGMPMLAMNHYRNAGAL
jgi:hypothetical protein